MTQKQIAEAETLPEVIEFRGGWSLNGATFVGDVKVRDPETGKTKWVSGEHSQADYNWAGNWMP